MMSCCHRRPPLESTGAECSDGPEAVSSSGASREGITSAGSSSSSSSSSQLHQRRGASAGTAAANSLPSFGSCGSTAVAAAGAAAQAASRATGAVGSGWALVAAARAAWAVFSEERRKHLQDSSPAQRSAVAEVSNKVPKHIAVIMDGNRRYGRQHFGTTIAGHKAGGDRLRDFTTWCSEAGVEHLTVYAFSTENWKREKKEVDAMMDLFLTEVPALGECTLRLNCRVRFLCCDEDRLPEGVRKAIRRLEEQTSHCTGLCLNVCLSYGGRSDVAKACQDIAKKVAAGSLEAEAIDEALVSQHLLTGHAPDPDVLIRTSGEVRLSNFLVFQLAYAEFFFIEKHWPAVTREDFDEILHSFGNRGRRFGK
eukprot:TRINITY_DN11868_c0_g1_i1.p1 TRINITY_DN11868_c0_g1~~TRINITY_DN11868_c0_g1_i1.p1  ORF type:complete len:367 (-),score=81.79 TRINITY_DN11868_c0_g1_i1:159-1259(-)